MTKLDSIAAELAENPGQWEAYCSSGNLVLLAGPGSGKTKTLTAKVAREFAERAIPDYAQCACITYSNECALELSRRLRAIDSQAARRTYVGTVHSFCLRHVLIPFGPLAGVVSPGQFRVADARTSLTLINRATDEVLGRPEDPRVHQATMSNYRMTYRDNLGGWKARDEESLEIFQCYQRMLGERGLLDFEDIVFRSFQVLRKHDWSLEFLCNRFPLLAIDEYQDLSPMLDALVSEILVRGSSRIIAVGDPDQSIYGFQGAQPNLLVGLSERDDFECVELTRNYRCSRLIVASSLSVLGEGREYESATGAEGTVQSIRCREGLGEQARVAVRLIVEEFVGARGTALSEIALLYPDRHIGDVIAAEVANAQLPFVRTDAGAPYRKTPLTRWLEAACRWTVGDRLSTEPGFEEIVDWWTRFASPNASDDGSFEEAVQLVTFLALDVAPEARLLDWLEQFHEELLEPALKRSVDGQVEADVVSELLAAAREGPLVGWDLREFAGQRGATDRLYLSSLHSAKGLEFDVVLMFGLDEGQLPRWSARSEAEVAEARRLFYVGMTRARHEVVLLHSGYTLDTYGREHHDGSSRFVREVEQELAR